jgi:hypothetical protein
MYSLSDNSVNVSLEPIVYLFLLLTFDTSSWNGLARYTSSIQESGQVNVQRRIITEMSIRGSQQHTYKKQ